MSGEYYCFDENVSHYLVDVLKHLRVTCCHVNEHFPRGTKDPEFLPFISEKGWILVSGDPSMMTTHAIVFNQEKVRAIFLPGHFVSGDFWHEAWWIFKHWPKIQEQAERAKWLGAGKITDNGKLEEIRVKKKRR